MREIDYGNSEEQNRLLTRSLERLDRFRDLDTKTPFAWRRHDPIFDEKGGQTGHIVQECTLTPGEMVSLKGAAITSEYLQIKELGGQDLGNMILHPPKL